MPSTFPLCPCGPHRMLLVHLQSLQTSENSDLDELFTALDSEGREATLFWPLLWLIT